jgi:hypothetical protein
MADFITWYVGTKKQCQSALPRIKQWAAKTSDEFKIISENSLDEEVDLQAIR